MRKIEKSIKFWRIFQSSLSYNGRLDGEDVDRLVDDWVRPGQLYHPPEMTKDGSARDDVIQGRLGRYTHLQQTDKMFRRLLDVGRHGLAE